MTTFLTILTFALLALLSMTYSKLQDKKHEIVKLNVELKRLKSLISNKN